MAMSVGVAGAPSGRCVPSGSARANREIAWPPALRDRGQPAYWAPPKPRAVRAATGMLVAFYLGWTVVSNPVVAVFAALSVASARRAARAIEECATSEVFEVRRLGGTLRRWRIEIINHHRTGDSNGPTDAMNLLIKQDQARRL
jgi:hypothetical protein